MQLGAILFLAIGIYTSGVLSDRFSAGRVILAGCLGTVAVGFLMGPMMRGDSLFTTWLFLSMALFLMGIVYGPLGALLSDLFPARVRYTGASVAFNTAGILGGAVTPLAAQALAERGGLTDVGLYLSAAALASFLGLVILRRKSAFNGISTP